MSLPRTKPLISDTEKERLKNPPIDPNIRKRNNLIVKEKIKRWLSYSKDIAFALGHLRNTKMEGVFADEDIFALFDAVEALLGRLNFAPIEGEPEHPHITYFDAAKAEDVKENKGVLKGTRQPFIQRASPADFERNWQVQEFVHYLQRHYYYAPEDESPAYKKYRKKREYKELKEGYSRHGINLLQTEEEYFNTHE